MNLQLFEKVVLISGGAKGIWRCHRTALAQEGAVPAIVDRDSESGKKLSTELRRAGARSLVISTDLTSSEDGFHAVEHAAKELGKIDALDCANALPSYS